MWVGLQEKDPNQPFYVKSYDAAKETVQVEYAHSTYTLPLRVAATPTVASSPVATGPIPMRPTAGTGPMPMTNVPTGSGPNFVPAGATDPNGMRDMRRMEQLAREAARLRAERARNLNSATAAGPTPAAPQKQ
jgi:hypothetical protein